MNRINQIVSDTTRRIMRIEEMKNHLRKLYYPENLLNDAANKVLNNKRLINRSTNNNSELVPFVTQFSTNTFTFFNNNIHQFCKS